MASIYDNFDSAYQKYRNRQRLTGGQIDPGVVGAMVEGDLNARYTDLKSRRAQDLQQQQINNQGRAVDNSYNLGMLNYGLAQDKANAEQKSSTIGSYMNIPSLMMSGYKMGQEAGLWGTKPESDMTKWINYLKEKNAPSSPSVGNTGYIGDVGNVADVATNFSDIGDYASEIPNYLTDYDNSWMDTLSWL